MQERDAGQQFLWHHRLVGEEIKIHRLAMPKPQRNRGPAIEDEMSWHLPQFRPEALLGSRQRLASRSKSGHSILFGKGGTEVLLKKRCQ
jgi:hypothetical protein